MSNTSTASVKNFIQNFGSIFKSTVSRFPVTVGLLVIAFVLTCFEVYNAIDWEDEIRLFLFFFTLTGAVLNVALVLWGDNCKSLRTKYIVFAVANIILLWYSVFVVLTSFEYDNHFATMVMPGLLAVILMIGLSVFCLPFFRCKNDLPFYNFSLQAISAILISALAVGILCGGISLLFTAIQHLFDIDRGSRLLTVINLAFVMLAFPVLVMMQLPKNEQLVDETECESNKFINALVRYLFIPLLALYWLVLYVYLIKILITFELPNGWVSILVSVSMFFMVLISMALYGDRITKKTKLDNIFVKYAPFIMMPLLLLMTVGIARRFNDYGITVSRLYLLLVNIWFWAVCILSIIFKQRRIIWIPASFCGLALLSSYGPWSMSNITLNTLRNQVIERLTAENLSLPISAEDFRAWARQSDTTSFSVESKLDYLSRYYDSEAYEDIVLERIYTRPSDEPVVIDGRDVMGSHHFYANSGIINLNRNVKTFRPIDTTYYFDEDRKLTDTLTLSFGKNDFIIKTLDFLEFSNSSQDEYIILTAPDATLAIKYYNFYIRKNESDLSIEGYLFEE